MRAALTILLLLLAAPVLAQTQTPEQVAANAVLLPMMTELSPQDGPVLAACVVAGAAPEEVAQIAAAGAPTPDLAPLVNAILTRPATLGCIQATLGG